MVDRGGGESAGVVDPHRLVAMLPELTPGEAAGLLAGIDRRVLTGTELTVLVQAECRVQAWLQAGLAESMDELAHCPDSPMLHGEDGRAARVPEASRFAAEEIALAASIAPGTAAWHLHRATFIRHRLPGAWQAWRAGALTQAKVFACYDELADCPDAVIDEFAATFFDADIRGRDGLTAAERAADDTAGQFRDRAHRLVARLDADTARRRRDRRVHGRRVLGRHDRDGVGYLSGTDLPLESVAAAYEYVDAIARALKNDGDQRSLDALRADVYTDLLTGGTGHHRYDLFGHPDDDDRTPPGQPTPDAPTPERSAEQQRSAEEQSAEEATDESATEPAGPVGQRPVHLVAPYDLLAGGHTPAELDGYGSLPADNARQLIRQGGRRRSHWALTVIEPATGRPTVHVRQHWQPPGASARAGPDKLIELLLPADALDMSPAELDPHRLLPRRLLRILLRKARGAPSELCAGAHERAAHDPTRAQRRFVCARDRYCCFPGCRRRAITCDIDHTRPWEHGGPTCACNLRPLCRRHHQTKQHFGWTLILDPTTGASRWTSPHGLQAHNDTHRLDPQLYQATPGRRRPRARPITDPDAT